MPIKIEQVTENALVINDYDDILTTQQMVKILSKHSDLKIESIQNPCQATYKGKTINLCVKNISYLGIPHLHYKKRIQIPSGWKEILQQDNTLLIGVYSYNGCVTFCIFDTKTYKNNNLNNSSAHIHTMDLYQARKLGIFKKTDKKDNNIIVFTESNFQKVFDDILFGKQIKLSEEINAFKEFSKILKTDWYGIECYREMIENGFNNAYQPEWAGFYLEYKFKQFLDNNPNYQKYCQYVQNKYDNAIDLDLWFAKSKFYGDLKAHTVNAGLLGNDVKNIKQAINEYKKIWYIVFSHHTEKDCNYEGEVTKFWNLAINNKHQKAGIKKHKELDSYLSKMKKSVKLDNFVILEINKINFKHLKIFNQGKNSDGNPRNTKISISKKDLENDNFAIYRQKLT